MNRQDITRMLDDRGITYRIVEHPPAYTVEDIDSFGLPGAEVIVKNLFLRDDKKQHYYLLVAPKHKPIRIKALRPLLDARPLSFASAEDLMRCLGVTPGAVTPLGVLNDAEQRVQVWIDAEVMAYPAVGIHPNENTATLWLAPEDLRRIIEGHGNPVHVAAI